MERWVKQKFELEIGGRYDLRFLKVFYVERLSTEIQKDEIKRERELELKNAILAKEKEKAAAEKEIKGKDSAFA